MGNNRVQWEQKMGNNSGYGYRMGTILQYTELTLHYLPTLPRYDVDTIHPCCLSKGTLKQQANEAITCDFPWLNKDYK